MHLNCHENNVAVQKKKSKNSFIFFMKIMFFIYCIFEIKAYLFIILFCILYIDIGVKYDLDSFS